MSLPEAMTTDNLELTINDAWDMSDSLSTQTSGSVREAIHAAMDLMSSGTLRVAERSDNEWRVNDWLKKAILMYFKINNTIEIEGGPDNTVWWDKVPNKFIGWTAKEYQKAGIRAVPNCTVRHSAFIAKDVVLMPSFVNVGAYVDEGTMVDTWSTIGSCAQIGKHCHISGGVGIGGVLEPLQAAPVIIEDNVFVGARSEIAEGVRVCDGAVISMGVFISASTKIIDRTSGEIFYGYVPPYSVVVPGTLPGKPLPDGSPGPNLACAVIVKQVDERTRSKTSINELLRE